MRGVSSATVIRLALSGLACSKGADWHPATPRNFPLTPPSPQLVAIATIQLCLRSDPTFAGPASCP